MMAESGRVRVRTEILGSARPFDRTAPRWMAAAAGGIALLVLLLLVPRLDDIGLTWDEPWYFGSALRIQDWATRVVLGPDRTAALQSEAIREAWDWASYYNPHPPAYKVAMAATEALTGRWLGSVRGLRVASALWFALLVAGVWWVGTRRWGWPAGLAAAVALLLLPRMVGHAHVAATDMPLAFFWFCGTLGLAAFLRGGGLPAGAVGAAGLGFAMATKFTGYLLPLPLLLWAVADRTARGRLAWAAIPVLGGLAVAYLLNPLAWHEPVGYVLDFFRESLGREEAAPIATYYLGARYPFSAPWHYAPVMTALTLPLGLSVLAVWGAVGGTGGWRSDWLGPLCLIQIAFFWLLLALPNSPTHDGVRLFLPAFPFIVLLMGRGLQAVSERVRARLPAPRQGIAMVLLGLTFFFPPLLQLAQTRPYYLSYYSELIGGARGAEARGMEATYWYDALTPTFLAELNEVLPEGAELATSPTQDFFRYLQAMGMLRGDIQIKSSLPSDYLLLYARKSTFDAWRWGLYRQVIPLRSITYQGVELVGLYAWADPAAAEKEAAGTSREGR